MIKVKGHFKMKKMIENQMLSIFKETEAENCKINRYLLS
jgi:hypothetical protein